MEPGRGVVGSLFDKYTERAKRVLMFAQEESRRLNHDYIGTEHLLLGLVREERGPAARILSGMGVELTAARDAVESVTEQGEFGAVGEICLTNSGKKVIEHAAEVSRQLGHNYIGTEHLLLGLVQDSWSTGTRVLSDMGIGQTQVRSAVQFMVGREEIVEPEERDRGSRLSLTEGAQKALKLAADEARRDGHRQVGTGHLLLGLAREGEGLAASELLSLGVNVQRFRQQVRQAVSQGEAS